MGAAEPPEVVQPQVGAFVAVYLDKYSMEKFPLIGKVTAINPNGNHLQLDWYVGSYSGVWRVCKQRKVVWSEEVKVDCILTTVAFTDAMRLSRSMVQNLKTRYEKYL